MSPLQRDPLALSGSGGMLHAEESALQAVGWSWGKQGARKRSEKERGGETQQQMLCQPHALPGTPPMLQWCCWCQAGLGAQHRTCAPPAVPCAMRKHCWTPLVCLGQDGEVRATSQHHVSGRKCGGVSFHSSQC